MKQSFLILVVCLITEISLGQTNERPTPRCDLKVNLGLTFTFLPDFNNWIIYAPDGMVVPGIYSPSNSLGLPLWSEAKVESKSQSGWHVEAELVYRLPKHYALSFSLGLRQLQYDLTTTYSHPDVISPITLDEYYSDFGETTLQYITVNPFNLSRTFLKDKLTVEIGPSFNFAFKESYNNVLVISNGDGTEQVFFDNIGEANTVMVGCNLALSCKILEPLEVRIATQFLNSPLYTEDGLYEMPVEKVHPAILQFGITILPLRLGK